MKSTLIRKRTANYNEQHHAILTQAAKLFAQRGYSATSVNEVAQACGLSKPALYHYMRDKYDLLVNICAGHVERLEALVEAVAKRQLAPQEQLCELIRCFVEAYADGQDAHRVLIADAKFLHEIDRTRVLDSERRIVTAFAQTITDLYPHLAAQQLSKPLTMLLFGMINWMFTWLKPNGALSYQTMAPLVTQLFFGGLTAVSDVPSKI